MTTIEGAWLTPRSSTSEPYASAFPTWSVRTTTRLVLRSSARTEDAHRLVVQTARVLEEDHDLLWPWATARSAFDVRVGGGDVEAERLTRPDRVPSPTRKPLANWPNRPPGTVLRDLRGASIVLRLVDLARGRGRRSTSTARRRALPLELAVARRRILSPCRPRRRSGALDGSGARDARGGAAGARRSAIALTRSASAAGASTSAETCAVSTPSSVSPPSDLTLRSQPGGSTSSWGAWRLARRCPSRAPRRSGPGRRHRVGRRRA